MEIIETSLCIIREKIDIYGSSIIFSIFVLIIGLFSIKFINKSIRKAFSKMDRNNSIVLPITTKTVKYGIILLIFSIILAKFNISITAFLAVFSSGILTLGLSLKDVFSNLAKGFQLKLTRPYAVGDLIEVNGTKGKVRKIDLLYTHIVTKDTGVVMFPNGILVDHTIINYSRDMAVDDVKTL